MLGEEGACLANSGLSKRPRVDVQPAFTAKEERAKSLIHPFRFSLIRRSLITAT